MSKIDGVCAKCKEFKPPSEWGAHRSWCLRCMADAQADYRSRAGRDEINRRQREWNADHPDKRARYRRKAHLKSLYGLTEDELLDLLQGQDNKCAGCDSPISYGGRGKGVAVVDHDHTTGAVRGILCSDCNFLLGHCGDNPDTLRRLIAYLQRSVRLSRLIERRFKTTWLLR